MTRRLPTLAFASPILALALSLAAPATHGQDRSKDQLERCDRPIGTIALAEPEAEYMQCFARYSLGSPTALLRMMVQQSRCFVVLERGAGMAVMKGEYELEGQGEAQAGSIMGKGQMVLADFVMNPAIQVVDNNACGAGGTIAGIGRRRQVRGLGRHLPRQRLRFVQLPALGEGRQQVRAQDRGDRFERQRPPHPTHRPRRG